MTAVKNSTDLTNIEERKIPCTNSGNCPCIWHEGELRTKCLIPVGTVSAKNDTCVLRALPNAEEGADCLEHWDEICREWSDSSPVVHVADANAGWEYLYLMPAKAETTDMVAMNLGRFTSNGDDMMDPRYDLMSEKDSAFHTLSEIAMAINAFDHGESEFVVLADCIVGERSLKEIRENIAEAVRVYGTGFPVPRNEA